jgi:hypothetical protein
VASKLKQCRPPSAICFLQDLKSQTAQRLAKQHQSRQRKHKRTNNTVQPKSSHVPTETQPSSSSSSLSVKARSSSSSASAAAKSFLNRVGNYAMAPQTFQHAASFESEFSAGSHASASASMDHSAHNYAAPISPTRSQGQGPTHHYQGDYYLGSQPSHTVRKWKFMLLYCFCCCCFCTE